MKQTTQTTLIFILALIPRIIDLSTFITYDEYDQLNFAALFLQAIILGDISGALVLGYPGVPTMALGALGLWLRYQLAVWGWLDFPVEGTITSLFALLDTTTSHPLEYLQFVRSPLVIVASLTITIIYLLLRQLINPHLAFIGTLVISFNPLLLALSRIIHVDAPLSYFMFVSFLAFVVYMEKGHLFMLGLSGLFGALAALSKTPSAILGPILVVTGLIYVLLPTKDQPRQLRWRRFIKAMFGWGLIAAVAFFALWPSMWSNPLQTLNHIIQNIIQNNEQTRSGSGIFWGPFNSDRNPLYYTYAFPFRWTPFTTLGYIFSLIMIVYGLWKRRKENGPPDLAISGSQPSNLLVSILPFMVSLQAFIILFIAPISIISRRSIRYTLPAMYPADLVAVLGWAGMLYLLGQVMTLLISIGVPNRFSQNLKRNGPKASKGVSQRWQPALLALTLIQIGFIIPHHPYYYAYFNPLLGGHYTAPYLVNMGLGEGLDAAARYLNQNPQAEQATTASWFVRQFAPFFKGHSVEIFDMADILTATHTVFYITQLQLGFPTPELLGYFNQRQPEKVITLGGVDYAWIYPGPLVLDHIPEHRYPLNVVFNDSILLAGLHIPENTVSADIKGGLPITLYWQGLKEIPKDFNISIRVVDRDGTIWGQVDRLPLGGIFRMPAWVPGQVIRDEYLLNLDPAMPPDIYTFDIILYDFETGHIADQVHQVGAINITSAKKSINLTDLGHLSSPQAVVYQGRAEHSPKLRLAGYTAYQIASDSIVQSSVPDRLLPGQKKTIKLYWQVTPNKNIFALNRPTSLSHDYSASIVARHANGQKVNLISKFIGPAHYRTDQWPPETILASSYIFSFPPDVPEGEYSLSVQTHPDLYRAILDRVILLEPPRVRDLPNPENVQAVDARFGDHITLIGYELELQGHNIDLVLYWQTSLVLKGDYAVFIHLSLPDETIVAQRDSIPVDGIRPTNSWLPDEFVIDRHTLSAPSGNYILWVGLYHPDTWQRLPIKTSLHSDKARLYLTQLRIP